jgi:Domain of unknown function (DUF1918)
VSAAIGDRVTVQPATMHARARTGTVEAVLGPPPSRYQVRWDDGRWSIIAPTDGALRVLPQPRRGARRTPRHTTASAVRKRVSDG